MFGISGTPAESGPAFIRDDWRRVPVTARDRTLGLDGELFFYGRELSFEILEVTSTMHRVSTARLLSRALRIGEQTAVGVPVFLCPAISRTSLSVISPLRARRFNTTDVSAKPVEDAPAQVDQPVRRLPVTCSGCGAFAQTTDPRELGYFDSQSKRVRNWLHPRKSDGQSDGVEDKIVGDVLKGLDGERLEALGLSVESMIGDENAKVMESEFGYDALLILRNSWG